MAPQNKRKRDGAQDSNRPSPHKPNDQHNFPRDPFSPSSRPVSSSSQAANTTSAPPNTTGSPFTFNANPASNISTLSATTSAAKANPDANAPDNAPFVPLDTSIQYDYFRLSSNVLEKWNNGGRDEIIDSAAKLVSGGDYRELTYWTKDLIWSVLSGNLQPVDAGEAMKQILGPPPSNEGAGNHGVGCHDDEDNINSTVDQYGFEPHAHFADTLNVIFEHDITRYRSHLIYFLKATGVRPMMLRELCDTQLLIKLGLIRETFPKLGIRHATNQLYRQTNYNLLREETEGYSKLMTELFTAGNAGPPTGTQARATFERIKALIGTFDLDVGRVLDVTLDVFASMLIKHFQFYVKLLRCSSWWPREEKPADSTYCGGLPDWALPESEEWQTNESEASPLAAKRRERDGKFWERARELHSRAFFELSGRHVVDEQTQSAFFSDVDTAAQVDARRRWIMETKTLPAPGNRTAAQLLGFKLRFYTHDARDSDDVLPANLLYLAALLIKIGFISLTDLVSHLWPDEDGMKLLRDSKMKELEEKERASRPGGAMNALAMAAALPDDTPKLMGLPSAIRDNLKSNDDAKSATHDEKEKPKLPDPVANSVWELLQMYPIQTRYKIYSDWYEGPISRLPAIRTAFNRTRLETLSTMKRLSLDNIAQMAKTLAKTSYSSPGIVFKVALDQIESYANLIEVFVECAKYFTELAYDVLVWSLLSSLGAGSRSRHQENSVLLTSKWLQALSRFSGKVFRRFAIMNPTPVLKYVNRQLSLGNSTDLIILKELVTTMGGIVPSLDFSDDQIMAMCGYETLRRQTLINGLDKRFDSAKSSKRLIQLLVDSKLAGQLLVNIARYRQNAIYTLDDDQLHVKYISSLVDDSHQILIQYLDFLGYNLDTADYVSNTPSIGMLMDKYKLDASLAFMIGRRSLSFNVHKSEPAPETDGDVEMADDAPKTTLPQTNIIYDTLRPLIEDIAKTNSPESWERITPEFFTTFWALQMGDIYVPEGRYEKEYTRAILQSKEVSKERSDMTHVGISKRAEKMKAFADIASQLSVERKQHRATCKKTLELLNERIDNWFQGSVKTPNAVSDAIIEQCLLPRLLLSPAEADFSYRMVRFLHDNNAANFKTMALFDRLFNANRLRSMLFICTVREAENMGRFLKCILTDFSRWHKDKAVYESEALGIAKGSDKRTLHGFATAFDVNDVATTWVEYDQFKDILWGWHKNIFNALKSAMSGSEWLHIRNGITILKCLLDCFPAVDFMARQFTAQLNRIAERESGSKSSPSAEGHRVDLSVAAQTALSELQRRKSKWVMVQSFRTNTMAESNQETTKSTLRPTAPEFRSERLVLLAVMNGKADLGEIAQSVTVDGTSHLPALKLPHHQLVLHSSSNNSNSNSNSSSSSSSSSVQLLTNLP
ncbi:THO complex subunit 2 [Ceratocystis platani]|uniref:THO complex subunit 2 n=1 Tax=Ceratocystis fimbriata f. sp. platani TaxID=88771 RepID=A0A0F8DEF8_CERFI|nr:THO complex subunit 2 [Ceratocystis platani]